METCESVVSFSIDGKKLFGVLHSPSKSSYKKPAGINILCPGAKYRVGPHRLNVKLARELCYHGYYVFRFDPSGIGDSEGDLGEGLISEIWGRIQRGLLVGETIAANRVFMKETGIEQIILLGLCGGAATAIYGGREDPDVEGVVAIDVPVRISKFVEPTYVGTITSRTYANELFKSYLKKAFDLRAWRNLLTFKTDYRALAKIIGLKLSGFFREYAPVTPNHSPNFNFDLLKAFDDLQKRRKRVLFIGAEKEHTTGEFEEEFLPAISNYSGAERTWEYHVIKNSNHVYTLPEWQNELKERIEKWLDQNGSVSRKAIRTK